MMQQLTTGIRSEEPTGTPVTEEVWTSSGWLTPGRQFGVLTGLVSGVMTATVVDIAALEHIVRDFADWTASPVTSSTLTGTSTSVYSIAYPCPITAVPRPTAEPEPSSPCEMVAWLHRESGLTWDQLARTLGVSRRSVHAWAAGQRVSGTNLERLSHVYTTIRGLNAPTPASRRRLLFAPRGQQPHLFDSLVASARKPRPKPGGITVAERLGIARTHDSGR